MFSTNNLNNNTSPKHGPQILKSLTSASVLMPDALTPSGDSAKRNISLDDNKKNPDSKSSPSTSLIGVQSTHSKSAPNLLTGGSSKHLLTALSRGEELKESKNNIKVLAEIKSQVEESDDSKESLPLIEDVKRRIPLPKDGGPNFKGLKFLTSQHLLKNTLPGMQFGLERGLNPEDLDAVGKLYSNHQETVAYLRKIGVSVTEAPPWATLYGFDDSFESACGQALKDFSDKLTPDITPIIVDDGGRIAQKLRASYPRHPVLKKAVLIEQTSSGANYLHGCKFPKINLYSSYIKTLAEPPLVAESTYKLLEKEVDAICADRLKLIEQIKVLRDMDPRCKNMPIPAPFIPFKESSFSICGAGNIGLAFMKQLIKAKVKEIRIFDTDRTKQQKAIELALSLGAVPPRQSVGSTDVDSLDFGEDYNLASKTEVATVGSVTSAIQNCNIMIGAAGVSLVPEGSDKSDYLVSTPVIGASISSGQKDFYQLLVHAQSVKEHKESKAAKERQSSPEEDKANDGSYNEPEINFANPCYLKNGYRGDGEFAFIRHGTPITFNNGPHAMPPKHAQITRTLIVGSELQAIEIVNERAICEKAGRKFINTGYQLSPLWQLYTAKMFLDTLSSEDKQNYYSEETLANMVNIKAIAAKSEGLLFLPFEQKLRTWLDGWLKENHLIDAVDQWLNPTPSPEVKSTPRIGVGFR